MHNNNEILQLSCLVLKQSVEFDVLCDSEVIGNKFPKQHSVHSSNRIE